MSDAASYLAVAAVMRWRQGLDFEMRKDFGRYRALLYELYCCLAEYWEEPPAVRAVYLEELWSIVGVWPRFDELAHEVRAFEARVKAFEERREHASHT